MDSSESLAQQLTSGTSCHCGSFLRNLTLRSNKPFLVVDSPPHRPLKQWSDNQSTVPLVSVDHGCGKSGLARYLIDEVLGVDEDRPFGYFFFKDEPDQIAAAHANRLLTRQLFWQKPEFLEDSAVRKLWADGDSLEAYFTDL